MSDNLRLALGGIVLMLAAVSYTHLDVYKRQEYRQALNQLTQQQRGYAQAGGTSMCEVCASLYCANACCQCMGGGC